MGTEREVTNLHQIHMVILGADKVHGEDRQAIGQKVARDILSLGWSGKASLRKGHVS